MNKPGNPDTDTGSHWMVFGLGLTIVFVFGLTFLAIVMYAKYTKRHGNDTACGTMTPTPVMTSNVPDEISGSVAMELESGDTVCVLWVKLCTPQSLIIESAQYGQRNNTRTVYNLIYVV